MAIQADAGEKHFTSDTVREVAVHGHALRRGALIGAGVFAVLGTVAICSHRGGADCAIIGPLGAAPAAGERLGRLGCFEATGTGVRGRAAA